MWSEKTLPLFFKCHEIHGLWCGSVFSLKEIYISEVLKFCVVI